MTDPIHIPKEVLIERENFEGLQFTGNDSSSEIFPHLGLSWEHLLASHKDTGLPIADIGSGFSSFPAEAYLKGIPVIPIDVMYPHRVSSYGSQVWNKLCEVRNCDSSFTYSDTEMNDALSIIEKRLLACTVDDIPLPSQTFSVTVAHDCVPKHSSNLCDFIEYQLPGILEVTYESAHIYPLEMHQAVSGGDLELVRDLVKDKEAYSLIKKTADENGFDFHIEEIMDKGVSRYCGIFTRRHLTKELPSYSTDEILRQTEGMAWSEDNINSVRDSQTFTFSMEEHQDVPMSEWGGADITDYNNAMLEKAQYEQEEWDRRYEEDEKDNDDY